MAETTEDPQTVEQFWAARDAHTAAVKSKIDAALAEIQVGVDANLYRDGITTRLNDARLALQHHSSQLAVPTLPLTPVVPNPAA